jgi:hypothetical protein
MTRVRDILLRDSERQFSPAADGKLLVLGPELTARHYVIILKANRNPVMTVIGVRTNAN